MSWFKGQLRSWGGGGMFDPFGLTGKMLPSGVDSLVEKGPLGNAGGIKEAAGTKLGSMLSGRAILQGGPRQQNMESARTFDVFGSPATAGANQQSTARLGAALYGAYMGAGALGGGSGTSAGGAMQNGTMVDGATSGGTATPASGGAPGWANWLRMGQGGGGRQQQYQPEWETLDDGTQSALLAALLRRR